jgi:hypothetical protein
VSLRGPALCARIALVALTLSCRSKQSTRATPEARDAAPAPISIAATVAVADAAIADDSDECRRVADEVARALPAVAREIDALEKTARDAAPGIAMGGVDFGSSDTDLLSWGIGMHTPERYEGAIWCSVSRSGDLSVNVYGDDVTIPASLQARVRRACRH